MAEGDPPSPSSPHEKVENFISTIPFPKKAELAGGRPFPPPPEDEHQTKITNHPLKPSIQKQIVNSNINTQKPIATQPHADFSTKPSYSEVVSGVKHSNHLDETAPILVGNFQDSFFDSSDLKPTTWYQGKPAVIFPLSEKQLLVEKLKFVLVGKFSHGRPTLLKIKEFFATLKLKRSCIVSVYDKKHIFIECACKSDFDRIWLKLVWLINGFVMRILKWTADFNPLKESSIVPVWIRLEGLPLYLFDDMSLLSIANSIGKPIRVDPRNVARTIVNSARICVELDVSQPLLEEVWISFEDDKTKKVIEGFWAKVSYDVIPCFCSFCFHIGHVVGSCKRRVEKLSQVIDQQEHKLQEGRQTPGFSDQIMKERMGLNCKRADFTYNLQGGCSTSSSVVREYTHSLLGVNQVDGNVKGIRQLEGMLAKNLIDNVTDVVLIEDLTMDEGEIAIQEVCAAAAVGYQMKATSSSVHATVSAESSVSAKIPVNAANAVFTPAIEVRPVAAMSTMAAVSAPKQSSPSVKPAAAVDIRGAAAKKSLDEQPSFDHIKLNASNQTEASKQDLPQLGQASNQTPCTAGKDVLKLNASDSVAAEKSLVKETTQTTTDLATEQIKASAPAGNTSMGKNLRTSKPGHTADCTLDAGSEHDRPTETTKQLTSWGAAETNEAGVHSWAAAAGSSRHPSADIADLDAGETAHQIEAAVLVEKEVLMAGGSGQTGAELDMEQPGTGTNSEERQLQKLDWSVIEGYAMDEIEMIMTSPTRIGPVFARTVPKIINASILDLEGSPVRCSEVIRNSARIADVRKHFHFLSNEKLVATLVEQGKYKEVIKDAMKTYTKEIHRTLLEQEKSIYPKHSTTENATSMTQEAIPKVSTMDEKEWTTPKRRGRNRNRSK